MATVVTANGGAKPAASKSTKAQSAGGRRQPPSKNDSAAFPGEIIQPGNIELRWDAEHRRLIVAIDCGPAACRAAASSKSGKSRILASTSGFWTIPVSGPDLDGLQLSLTATLPAKG